MMKEYMPVVILKVEFLPTNSLVGLSNRIAAVASVSGSMMTDTYRNDPAPNGYGFPVCSIPQR